MRYIGNKTKLLDFIGSVLDEQRIQSGIAFDAFSGTASVGRYLKRHGFDVYACDLMTYSFVFQKALIETDCVPQFGQVINSDATLSAIRRTPAFRRYVDSRFGSQADLFASTSSDYRAFHDVACYLEQFLPGTDDFITTHFSADDSALGERMFFTRGNARRIDAVRVKLEDWRRSGLLGDGDYYPLLASLLEAADAVANTTGVYAAFVKSWQANSQRPLRLSVPNLVINTGRHCEAIQGDANDVIDRVPSLTLLYLDPPYNTRQYSSYYHVPELIAKGWHAGVPSLRGKTGLIEDSDKKSKWSTRGGCISALDQLLSKADARHVLMSYNSEGIIAESEIIRLFKHYGKATSFRTFELVYDRYRSDSDHEERQYKSDMVTEKIYYVSR